MPCLQLNSNDLQKYCNIPYCNIDENTRIHLMDAKYTYAYIVFEFAYYYIHLFQSIN